MYSSFLLTTMIFLFLTLISTTGTSSVTKRDSMNFIQNFLPSSREQDSCSFAVKDALRSCQDKLNFPTSQKNEVFRCCRFARFRKCMKDYVSGTCGSATDGVVDKSLYNGFQDWRDCVEYNYYSLACIFDLWITFVAAFVVITGCCCCCLVCCIRCLCCC